jgi:hypothetical protein
MLALVKKMKFISSVDHDSIELFIDISGHRIFTIAEVFSVLAAI